MIKWKHNSTNIKTLMRIINNSKHFGWFCVADDSITLITSVAMYQFEFDEDLLNLLVTCKKPDLKDVSLATLSPMADWEELDEIYSYKDAREMDDNLIYFNYYGDRYSFDPKLFLPVIKDKRQMRYIFRIRYYGDTFAAFIIDNTLRGTPYELSGVILGYKQV